MTDEKREFLEYILDALREIRDGMLGDSTRTHAAYNLGVLLCCVEFNLAQEDEEEEEQEEKEPV